MTQSSETSVLEMLARDTNSPLADVTARFEREREALADGATITNFITLLAVRRVRHQLLSTRHH